MPELPEVETVRRSLEEKIVAEKIGQVKVMNNNTIKYPSVEQFITGLVGERFSTIGRRGKYLVFTFVSGNVLLVHLRMTGQLLYVDQDKEDIRHTQVILDFLSGKQLRFVDTRNFGTMHYFQPEEYEKFEGINKLGPDPTREEYTLDWWLHQLGKKKTKIKALLLDQTFVAGIGNIYADESLFRAQIKPDCPAYELNEKQATDLFWSVKQVLMEGIEHRGTSISDYLDAEGNKGEFQHYLQAYGRVGNDCIHCGEPITKMKLAGRSTYYCPRCQGG